MIENYYRIKLLNAVILFCSNTKRCNTTKLLKLLSFLDFTHFKETGYPSIGLQYFAWKRGPVPKDFYEEIRNGNVPEDFSNRIVAIPQSWGDEFDDVREFVYTTKKGTKADTSIFTPRELKVINRLSDIYRDATASQMSEITHLHNSPWNTTVKEKGINQPIDYILCIDDESPITPEEARDRLSEHIEMLQNLKISH